MSLDFEVSVMIRLQHWLLSGSQSIADLSNMQFLRQTELHELGQTQDIKDI